MISKNNNNSKSDSHNLSPDQIVQLIRVTEPKVFLALVFPIFSDMIFPSSDSEYEAVAAVTFDKEAQ